MQNRERVPVAVWTAVSIAWLAIIWVWGAFHLTMTVDDTFYYFKTAVNVSRGLGSTFDGINRTNGYHPLWLATLALVGAFVRDDMVVFTRVAFTLQIAAVWGGGMLLARLKPTGGARVLWPLSLALANPFVAKIVLCGQETAFQFLLSSAILVGWWNLRSTGRTGSAGRWAGLAVAAALTTLTRLDGAFFCGLLLAMPLLAPSDSERASGLAARLRTTTIGFGVYTAALLPYLAYNVVSYGHLMPVSGAIKMALTSDEIAPRSARLGAVLAAVLGIAAIGRLARRRPDSAYALLAPPIAACAVLAVYNFGVRGEMSAALIRVWYLEPYLLAAALAIGALAMAGTTRLPARALALGAAALCLAGAGLSWKYRLQPRSYSLYQAAERCSRWFDRNSAPGAVAAAWDTGYVGAFTSKPVMNLDGLVNSWEYKERFLDLGKVDEFVFNVHPVDYVVQYAWPTDMTKLLTRLSRDALPQAPVPRTSLFGGRDPRALSVRWGVDVASFTVAHYECLMVSVATKPSVTRGPVYYFVLGRTRVPGRPTLAEFARANGSRPQCPAPDEA
jgi:hypothetical protein